MGGYNPLNIDALVNAPQQDAVDAQNQNNIQQIVQGGANQPRPTLAQQPQSKSGSPLKNVLGRFFYGAGQSMLHQAGMPTDVELQTHQMQMQQMAAQTGEVRARTQQELLNVEMLRRRMTAMQNLSANDPFASLGQLSPDEQALAVTARQEAAMKGDLEPIHQGIKQIVQQRAIWGRGAAQGNYAQVQVTPEMVQSGVPKELLGQTVPSKLVQPYMNRAVFGQQPVMGAGGPALANRNPMSPDFGKVTPLGLGNPGVAVAGARAALTPFETFDENGNLITTSAANAIAQGAPKATAWQAIYGPTSSTKTAGQAAGAVTSHIPELRQEIATLGARGDLGPVMGRLNEWMNSGYGGNDPLIGQFVANMKLMNSGTVRAHFGARGGQQVLDQFNRILNTSQEPQAINGALNGIESWLNKYGDIGVAKGPRTNIRGSGIPQQVQQGMAPPRPSNVPANYIYKENGPKGTGWYKP